MNADRSCPAVRPLAARPLFCRPLARIPLLVRSLAATPLVLGLIGGLFAAAPGAAATKVLGDLPRRGWLGVSLARGDANLWTITAVTPKECGDRAGLKVGDALLEVNDIDPNPPGALAEALSKLHAGDSATVHVRRAGKDLEKPVKLGAVPFEQSDEYDVVYDVVETGTAKLRSVLLEPHGMKGKMPAILFVQGLQCAPVDEPAGPPSTVLQLLQTFVRSGYVVMRCEKPGAGDATGEPCSEIDFDGEMGGFRAALAKLRSYDFVDTTRVFLFGHSLGGIEAPILAAETPVRGVMVYGTEVLPWGEYLVVNERRQLRLDPSTDLVAAEAKARNLADFLHEVFRKHRSIDDVVKERPAFAQIAEEYWPDHLHSFGHHLDYYRQLDAVNLADEWSKVQAPVLIMFGELDYTVSWQDAQYIEQIVNAKHPGAARAVQIPHTFHAFNIRDSVEQTLTAPWQGPLSEDVVKATKEWLAQVDKAS